MSPILCQHIRQTRLIFCFSVKEKRWREPQMKTKNGIDGYRVEGFTLQATILPGLMVTLGVYAAKKCDSRGENILFAQ